MSAYYAVTSLSGRDGTWVIVADGNSVPAVEQLATSIIMGASGSTSELNLPESQRTAARRMNRLEVLSRAWTIARVGLAKMQQYEKLTRSVTQGVQSTDSGSGGASSGGASSTGTLGPGG